MASHQHHCHHHCNHHPPPPPPPPPSHFCCGCGCGCSPSITPTDPLLQALATHLLQSQSPPHYSSSSSSSYLLKPHQSKSPSYKYQQPTNTSHSQSQPLLHSLAGRVAALESSLQRLSLSSPNTVKDFSFSSVRLRDVAARTIQTHFRAFLARRSQTLRQLRLLAGIRANLASLKASCSDGAARFRAAALSQKAADLLVKLDSIQSVDLMIRDGKRSVGAELVQFLELMDGIARRRVFSSKTVRKVSFADNAKANKMHTREPEIESDEHSEVSSDDQLGFVETLGKVAEGNKEFSVLDDEGAHVELERFHQLSDDDLKKYRVDLSGEGSRPKNGAVLEQIFNGGLSAPVPVQMEPRGSESDLMQKRKVVRILSP